MYTSRVFLPVVVEPLIQAPFPSLAIFSADNVNGYDERERERKDDVEGWHSVEHRVPLIPLSHSVSVCYVIYMYMYNLKITDYRSKRNPLSSSVAFSALLETPVTSVSQLFDARSPRERSTHRLIDRPAFVRRHVGRSFKEVPRGASRRVVRLRGR